VHKLGKNWQTRAWDPVFKTAGSTPDAAMKIKISKSRLSLLISGIICLNLLKNKIFEIKIWSRF
jgi:hypothetical protein